MSNTEKNVYVSEEHPFGSLALDEDERTRSVLKNHIISQTAMILQPVDFDSLIELGKSIRANEKAAYMQYLNRPSDFDFEIGFT